MNTAMQLNGMQPGPQNPMMMAPQGANGAMPRPVEQASDDPNVNLAEQKKRLNTAIYDYFLKMGEYDLARNLKSSQLQVKTDSNKRKADDDDLRDDPNRPSDLPPAGIPLYPLTSDTAFLLDWYSIFYDLFTRDPSSKSTLTGQYLQHTQHLNRIQQQQQQSIMRQGLMPNNQQQMLMRNNMMMRNPAAMNPQQQQMMRRQMMHASMARDGSAMDGDGNRPRTPSSGDNAPSPPKRQRIDGQPFAPGMMNGGAMPGQMGDPNVMHNQRTHNLLIANGINPAGMTPQQIQNFGAQSAQRANMGGQGSPNMMNPNMDMQQIPGGNGDFYNNGNNINRAGVNGQNGHALQDYQMQLMLLERQNRKRLEMAKQEQEVGGVGQNGNMQMPFAPNMSPQGSRNGPSPNPNDMKRGTPQIPKAGIPGSPMPDGGPRASPSAMGYSGMQGMENGMRPGPNMQPPSSHPGFPNGIPAGMNPQQMAAMRNPAGGPMPGQPGFQPGPGGVGPGNGQPGPNGQIGTPRQGNAAMPPPQGVPPSNGNATGRAPSPAPSAAASTPQTTNKANPKKESKKDRKPSTKKGKAAATPAENTDAPATSQPATPLTPALANGGAFDKNNKNSANGPNGNANQNAAPVPASQNGQPAALTNDMHDNDMGLGFPNGDLDFATDIQAGDVLEQFNFDAFIDDGTGNFDSLNFDMGGFEGSIEAGLEGQA